MVSVYGGLGFPFVAKIECPPLGFCLYCRNALVKDLDEATPLTTNWTGHKCDRVYSIFQT